MGRRIKRFLLKGLLLAVVVVVGLQLVVNEVRAAGEAVSNLRVPGVLTGGLPGVISNPFLVLAALLAVAYWWWRGYEKRLGGQEAAAHRLRTRLGREGLSDLLRAKPARAALAGGAAAALVWYWISGSALLFVPVVGGALYAWRAKKKEEDGGDDPDRMLLPTRYVREPLWSFSRYQDAPADYEVWHFLGEGYRSRHLHEHVLLAGRTGHGKGQTVLLWAIAHSIKRGKTSTVTADPKGEAYEETVALAAARRDEENPNGRPVWLLSTLSKHPPGIVAGLNPCSGPEETARFASAIIPDTREPVWGQGARELFNSLARAIGYPRDCLLQVYELVKYVDRLKELAERNEEVAAAYNSSKPGMEENFRKGVKAALSALERERVRRLFRGETGGEEIDFRRINVVYLCFDPNDDADARPLLAGLLDYLYARAYAAGDPEAGGPGAEFIVDEAKKCAAIHRFPDYLAIARGNRVRFLVCVQNVSQLVDELGEPAAEDLLDSLPLKIFGQSGDGRTKRRAEGESGCTSVVRKAAGGRVPLLDRLMDPRRARMAEWSGRRWERRPRVTGDHMAKLPKNEWFVFGDGVAEHVVGAHWRDHARGIVTPQMRSLPVNHAGVVSRDGIDFGATPTPTAPGPPPPPPTEEPAEDREIPPQATGRDRPRLHLILDDDGDGARRLSTDRRDGEDHESDAEEAPTGDGVRCLYCPQKNPAGSAQCEGCGMPLELG